MVNKLATIAVIGLATSAVCMGAAAAIGGPAFGEGFGGIFDERPRCQVLTDATETSRDLDWHGGPNVTLEIPAQASYSPSNGERLHASGDPQILAHLRIKDGDIELDCRGWHDRVKTLQIALPGREFRKFTIEGGGALALNDLNQADAELRVEGSGKIRASGKVDNLKMAIEGSGDADFNQIVAHRARVEIEGSGTVRAKGGIEDLHIEIEGSGRADLDEMHSRTARVEIEGSGTIKAKGQIDDLNIQIDGSGGADFGQVASRNARVEIGGHGDVHIAPSEEAKIDISGSGDVYLHSNPKQLETEIGGSGRLHRVAAAGG